MRPSLTLALLGALLWAGSVSAGLYHPAEPQLDPDLAETGQPMPYSAFQILHNDLLNIAVAPLPGQKNPLHSKFLDRAEELGRKERRGQLSPEERVNLSAYYIRLGEYQKASDVLQPLSRERNPHFMVLANLATAEQLAGRPERARVYLSLLREAWPQQWPGMTAAQLAWYKKVEGYQQKLVMLPVRVDAARYQRSPMLATVEYLFAAQGPDGKLEPVQFAGPSGQYEAGTMAEAEKAKLPPDAIAIVQQLLVWLPTDPGLFWLLGELYNASGDVETARRILNDCVDRRRLDAPGLREHRQVLNEAARAPKAEDPPASWVPNSTQIIVVGSIVGIVIALLLFLQFREIFRRLFGARPPIRG